MIGDVICFEWHPESSYYLKNVVSYTALQAINGAIFHIVVLRNGSLELTATVEGKRLEGARVFKDVIGFHGIRGNTLFIRTRLNVLLKAAIIKGRIRINEYPLPSMVMPPMVSAVFNIDSGPNRAIRMGTDLRILSIDLNVASRLGVVLGKFNESLDAQVAARSVLHKGFILLFFAEATNSCRRMGQNVIYVESPLLHHISSKIPFFKLVYAQDECDLVYVLVPVQKAVLIIDPGNLRVRECRLSFGQHDSVEDENKWEVMSLVGVSGSSLMVGFPEFRNSWNSGVNRTTGLPEIIGYTICTGSLPCSSEENSGNDISNLSKKNSIGNVTSWNTDVPEFVPHKVGQVPVTQTPNSVSIVNEDIEKQQTPEISMSMQEELRELRESNARLEKLVAEMKRATVSTIDRQTQTEDNPIEKLVDEQRRLVRRLNLEEWKVAAMKMQLTTHNWENLLNPRKIEQST